MDYRLLSTTLFSNREYQICLSQSVSTPSNHLNEVHNLVARINCTHDSISCSNYEVEIAKFVPQISKIYRLIIGAVERLFVYKGLEKIEFARIIGQLWIRTSLGDSDEAFKALLRQAELHIWSGSMLHDPLLQKFRTDPRFPESCAKVGISS